MADDRRSKIIHEGYGFKQGSGGGLFGRMNWKKRYFVLSTAGFHYFTEQGGSLIDSYPRTGIGMVKKSDTPKKKNQFYVEIDVWNAEKGNRLLKMYTTTEEEREEWIKAFQRLQDEPDPRPGKSGGGAKVNVGKHSKEELQSCEGMKQKGNEEFGKGNHESAIKEYTSVIDALTKPPSAPVSDPASAADVEKLVAICYNNRSMCFLKTEKWDSAVSDASKCLSLEPQNVKALLRRATAYENQNKIDLAVEDCESVLRLDPSVAEAQNTMDRLMAKKATEKRVHAFSKSKLDTLTSSKNKANTTFQSGRLEDAIKLYTEIVTEISSGPTSEVLEADAASRESIVALEVACRNNRCAAFLKLSKWQEALNDATWVLQQQPENIKALIRQTEAAEALERWHTALEAAERVVQLDPSTPDMKAKVERLHKKIQSTSAPPPTAASNPTKNNPPASASGGGAAKAKGFSASQLSTAQKHKDEGNAKFKTGNHWDAMQCYKAAIDTLHDKNRNTTGSGRVDEDQVVEVLAAALNNRALCHKGLGDYGAMYADASSCLEIQPKNVKALARRAQAAEELGMNKQAIADCEAALEITEMRECRDRLNRLNVDKKHAQQIKQEQNKAKAAAESAPKIELKSLAELNTAKTNGNGHFSAGRLGKAIEVYSSIIDSKYAQSEISSGNAEVKTLVATCHNNRAACNLSLENYFPVVQDTTQCLQYQPGNLKALLRRAKASEALHMKDKAIADCRQLLQLSPGLGEAQEMINRLS